MNIKNAKTSLIIFSITAILLLTLVVYPLVGEIQKESQRFLSEKRDRAEIAFKVDNFKDIGIIPLQYPLVYSAAFLDFLEFIEKEAESSRLSVKVEPGGFAEEEPWPSFGFRLELEGSFSDFVGFLKKMESADYLIYISGFNLAKGGQEDTIKASLLEGKVYGKVF